MKKATLLLIAAFALPALAQAPQKVAADKSYIRFVSKQMNVPVEGKFRKFDATVTFDPRKPEAAKAEFEVDLASIDLGSPEGETEAVRPLWFNTAAFPKAKFVAASVKSTGPNKFEATGALTIKGITQNVTAPFTMTDAAGTRQGLRASFDPFGQPINRFQAVQLKIADMATQVQAARLLTWWAASVADTGKRADMESGMAKLFASEVAITCALDSMRLHGGYGYSTEFDVERLYRDAPLMAIGEGTNDILRTIIAKNLMKGL